MAASISINFSGVTTTNKEDQHSWLSVLGFLFLTYNTTTVAYRSINDLPTVAFVLVAYLQLLVFFWCVHDFVRSNPNMEKLEVAFWAVWMLATLLTTMFSYRVAGTMPWPVALVIWCLEYAGFRSIYPQRQLAAAMESSSDAGV